jgi:hypothetical protein
MTRALPFLLPLVLAACSSSGATAAFDASGDDVSSLDSAVVDSSAGDVADGTPVDSTRVDTAVIDTATVDTGPEPDTARPDLGLDAVGTFACGAERCGATFQFCQIDAAPGTGRHCVALPAACFAFPSCPCVTTKICGAEPKGTCTDDGGAITLQCK